MVGQAQIDVVRQVKELGPELDFSSLVNLEGFCDRQVQVLQRWSPQRVSTEGSEASPSRSRKGRSVDPTVGSLVRRNGIGPRDNVGSVSETKSSANAERRGLKNSERTSGLERQDPVDTPSVQDMPRKAFVVSYNRIWCLRD